MRSATPGPARSSCIRTGATSRPFGAVGHVQPCDASALAIVDRRRPIAWSPDRAPGPKCCRTCELSASCGYTVPAGRVNSPSQISSGNGLSKNATGAREPPHAAGDQRRSSRTMRKKDSDRKSIHDTTVDSRHDRRLLGAHVVGVDGVLIADDQQAAGDDRVAPGRQAALLREREAPVLAIAGRGSPRPGRPRRPRYRDTGGCPRRSATPCRRCDRATPSRRCRTSARSGCCSKIRRGDRRPAPTRRDGCASRA